MIIKNKKYSKKFIILAATALVVIGSASVGAYFLATNKSTDDVTIIDPKDYANRPVSNGIDYSPPTEDEMNQEKDQARRDAEREKLDAQPAATNAEITVTDAAQYNSVIEVRAYISNLYETGGSCTATFSKPGQTNVAHTISAMTDAKTIQCGALDLPRSKFPASGSWNLVVSYKSSKASGSSKLQQIVIK